MSQDEISSPLAIIGCGFSAAALVAHLCADNPHLAQKMVLVGEGAHAENLGAGAAFGTESRDFRLNVRADIMKFFPDQPNDFELWAKTNINDPEAHTQMGAFYRRRDYARYIKDRLDRICHAGLPKIVDEQVLNLEKKRNGWRIICVSGKSIHADIVVLATGNPPPRWSCRIDKTARGSSQLVENPWSGRWLDGPDPDANICFIGGGLTALDGLYALFKKNHRGKISVITPLGLFPPRQSNWKPQPAIRWPEHPQTATKMLHFMRSALAKTSQDWNAQAWQEILERLRADLNEQWRKLSPLDKTRLLKAAGRWWNLARYRAAPMNISAVETMQATGQLDMIAGRIKTISAAEKGFQLTLENGESCQSDWVINCSGTAKDILLERLITAQLIQPCAFGLGPELTDELAINDYAGKPYSDLFAIGAMTKGSCGDVVGAGTIAGQAALLSAYLGRKLHSHAQ